MTTPRSALLALSLPVLALGAAACGGSDAEADASATTVAEATTTAAPTTATTAAVAAEETTTTTESSEPTLPAPAAWDAARFDEAITATMDTMQATIGQPFSADVVAESLLLADVPTPGVAAITGLGWSSEYSARRDGYEYTDSVGLDVEITPDALEAWNNAIGDGFTAKSFASSGNLYTTLATNDAGDRLSYVLDTEPVEGSPALNLSLEAGESFEVRTPEWLASLPAPEGGSPSEVVVGLGEVRVGLGGVGGNGNVFVRIDYAPEDFESLVAYFEDGILVGAGFDYEPSPLNIDSYRRDVRIGDWSGTVKIGEVISYDQEAEEDVLDAYQVIWSLVRD